MQEQSNIQLLEEEIPGINTKDNKDILGKKRMELMMNNSSKIKLFIRSF